MYNKLFITVKIHIYFIYYNYDHLWTSQGKTWDRPFPIELVLFDWSPFNFISQKAKCSVFFLIHWYYYTAKKEVKKNKVSDFDFETTFVCMSSFVLRLNHFAVFTWVTCHMYVLSLLICQLNTCYVDSVTFWGTVVTVLLCWLLEPLGKWKVLNSKVGPMKHKEKQLHSFTKVYMEMLEVVVVLFSITVIIIKLQKDYWPHHLFEANLLILMFIFNLFSNPFTLMIVFR